MRSDVQIISPRPFRRREAVIIGGLSFFDPFWRMFSTAAEFPAPTFQLRTATRGRSVPELSGSEFTWRSVKSTGNREQRPTKGTGSDCQFHIEPRLAARSPTRPIWHFPCIRFHWRLCLTHPRFDPLAFRCFRNPLRDRFLRDGIGRRQENEIHDVP